MHLIVVKNLRQVQCRLMAGYAFNSMRRVGVEPGRAGPTVGSGARAGQSKQVDASTRSTAIWAQVDLQSSLLFVGRLGIGFSVFQLVFQAKMQTEIKPINQYINQSIQLSPAHIFKPNLRCKVYQCTTQTLRISKKNGP
ncbi:hypothetical protein KSS93_06720 [Pseudomonas xanthosomatis]|uniref:hypothetical protein n=1 Tax=Pseudomonas xanthosomatis TaxID=2842356 RepID=UPI001C3D680E|nr:hypothetical protein [Pseudomonas xanthosomatis]QXH47608.1 hypothetical protein KSS93_06720 [Pseudomonas xanthosomatis]